MPDYSNVAMTEAEDAEAWKRAPAAVDPEIQTILRANVGKSIRLPKMSPKEWESERLKFTRAASSLDLVLSWKEMGGRWLTRVRKASDVKPRSEEALVNIRKAAAARAEKNRQKKAAEEAAATTNGTPTPPTEIRAGAGRKAS